MPYQKNWSFPNPSELVPSVLIDVREAEDFEAGHLPGSQNVPLSTFTLGAYLPYSDHQVLLICQSGSQARQVMDWLHHAGFHNVRLAEQQIDQVPLGQLSKKKRIWKVELHFRLFVKALFQPFKSSTPFLQA